MTPRPQEQNNDTTDDFLSPDACVESTVREVECFYAIHTHIKKSHGLSHVMAVCRHAQAAMACCSPPLAATDAMEVCMAALLHDVDDRKYFPDQEESLYSNARNIVAAVDGVSEESCERIVCMIDMVSCSKNGNSVSPSIVSSGNFHWLIPRWSDRLEAVGTVGVIRCYQYTKEKGHALSSNESPRATTVEEVWKYATPERFEAYQSRGGTSKDMISHYYDKLLHVACPPKDIVKNSYLEKMAEESSKALIEVCLRFGRTGVVDEDYILELCSPER